MNTVVDNAKQLPMMIEQGAQGQVSASSLILDASNMQQIMEFGKYMASGRSTIPDHLKGNPADCSAVTTQSMMWRMNPWAVAQKTHIVNGTLGYESQLVNAAIQSSGVTKDRFHYEWYGPWEKIIGKTKVVKVEAKGDKKAYEFRVPDYGMADEAGLGVKVWATIKGETEPRVLDLLLVQASVRNSPLWATDPKQQLAYLAVKRWARLYAPDVILGVYTPDELEESRTTREIDITPKSEPKEKPIEYCSAEKFNKNREAWKLIVTSGRKTAPELIVFLESKSPLTEEQKKEINTWRQAPKEPVSDADPLPKDPVSDSDPFIKALDQSGDYTPE
jgi:hypothetical protein